MDNLLSNSDNVRSLENEDYDAALAMLIKKVKILLKGAVKHNNHALIKDCESRLVRWEA